MSFSSLKDVDREILKHIHDKDLLKICSVDRKSWNEVCDDNFLRRRLMKYSGIEKYKREKESWKSFYLRAIYYIAKMQEKYQYIYEEGDFKKQYDILEGNDENDVLYEASEKGEYNLVKYVLERTGFHDYDLALELASRNGHLNIMKLLLEKGADMHTSDDYPLISASENGHINVVQHLVENGADIHALDDEALKLASKNGHIKVVQYLVENGADISTHAINLAHKYSHTDVAEYLENI